MAVSNARKWIELNWLRNGHKEITLPNLIFGKYEDGGAGVHWPKQDCEVCIEGRFYSLKDNGLILINTEYDDDADFIINTLAHEWRHCYQKQKVRIKIESIWERPENDDGYKQSIINYYMSYWWEWDALKYSIKKHPCDDSLEWYEWVMEAQNVG